MSLERAARKFRDAFTYDPGHSDLDNEQPIHITVTLGDWRLLNRALSLQPEVAPTFEAAHVQDAPRTLRNVFTVQYDGKRADVVFASFASCLEREANQLRATPEWNEAIDAAIETVENLSRDQEDIGVAVHLQALKRK